MRVAGLMRLLRLLGGTVLSVVTPSPSASANFDRGIVREKKLSSSAQRIIPIYRDLSDKSWPHSNDVTTHLRQADRICFSLVLHYMACAFVNDTGFLILSFSISSSFLLLHAPMPNRFTRRSITKKSKSHTPKRDSLRFGSTFCDL